MAKKISNSTESGKGSLIDLLKSIDDSAEILAESETAVISDYIDTGFYILNACMTGSLFKGVPCGRFVTLAGESGCGKSYLAMSVCRNAQKKGYTPIYLDSEGAIDREFVERLGCDSRNFFIKQVSTIKEVSSFIANFCKKELELPKENRHKCIIVIDSLGNLTSEKEMRDTLAGEEKADFTKQKDVKALFRTNATPIAKLGIPVIVTSHTYSSMEFISKEVVSGGSGLQYNASLTIMMTKAKLNDKESEKAAENRVGEFERTGSTISATSKKSRFTIPQKVKFHIPFFKAPNPYVGLEAYLTWENSGIIQGKALTQKEFDKLSPADQKWLIDNNRKFSSPTGEVLYALNKDTSRSAVIKHLGCEVPIAEIFSSKVMTEEVLRSLDEQIIKPSFQLPSADSNADLEEFLAVTEEMSEE